MKTRLGKQEIQPHDWRKKMVIDINNELFLVNLLNLRRMTRFFIEGFFVGQLSQMRPGQRRVWTFVNIEDLTLEFQTNINT